MSADMSDDENITSQEFDEENSLKYDMSGEENGLDSDMFAEDKQNSRENYMSYQASFTSLTSSSSSSSSEDSDSDQDYVMITKYFRSLMEYINKHYFKQPQHTNILSGRAIEEIFNGNDSTCFEMFHVHIPVFRHLCYTLRLHRLIVEDEGDISLKESVAMFLYIVSHNAR